MCCRSFWRCSTVVAVCASPTCGPRRPLNSTRGPTYNRLPSPRRKCRGRACQEKLVSDQFSSEPARSAARADNSRLVPETAIAARARKQAWSGEAVITTDRLVKRYGQVEALKGVSLSVAKGEIYGLLGQNGAGKTTMVKLLLGIIRETRSEERRVGEGQRGERGG